MIIPAMCSIKTRMFLQESERSCALPELRSRRTRMILLSITSLLVQKTRNRIVLVWNRSRNCPDAEKSKAGDRETLLIVYSGSIEYAIDFDDGVKIACLCSEGGTPSGQGPAPSVETKNSEAKKHSGLPGIALSLLLRMRELRRSYMLALLIEQRHVGPVVPQAFWVLHIHRVRTLLSPDWRCRVWPRRKCAGLDYLVITGRAR